MAINIAYLRVSTLDQDLEKNKSEILHLANDRNLGQVRFVEEKVSGESQLAPAENCPGVR